MNVFFVNTPFQLLTAQNLVLQKKLKNNLLFLTSTNEDQQRYFDSYALMLVDGYWSHIHHLTALNHSIIELNKPFFGVFQARKFVNHVESILKDVKPSAYFFGDIDHPFYWFWIFKERRKEVAIHFFEEGMSHYSPVILYPKQQPHIKLAIKGQFFEFLNRLVFGVKGLSGVLYNSKPRLDLLDNITVYNLLPFSLENRVGELVEFNPPISAKVEAVLQDQLKEYIEFKAAHPRAETNLYLGQTLNQFYKNFYEDEEFVLRHILQKWEDKKQILLIKFHPLDSEEKRQRIMSFLNNQSVACLEVFRGLGLPFELLFKQIPIDRVIGYSSSSQVYARQFIPDAKSITLMPLIINHLRTVKHPTKNLEFLYGQLTEIHTRIFGSDISTEL